MDEAVPHQLLGLAIFVSLLSLVAVFLGLLLCFMLWCHGERLSYILMLSATTTVGATNGVVQRLDYALHWRTIKIERFKNYHRPNYSLTSMFGKSDTGWRSVISWIAIYTYNVDSLLVLFWAVMLLMGTFNISMKSSRKKTMSIVLKTTAVVLPAIMVGLCTITDVQNVPAAYLVTLNTIMFSCLTLGSLLVIAVLYKYLESRNLFRRSFATFISFISGSSSRSVTISSAASQVTSSGTDKWLIIRFGIIMIILIIFEGAVIVFEIVNFQRNRRIVKESPTEPDFSIEQTKIDLYQLIPGTFPSIIAFCVFGTTAPFGREYVKAIKKCFCCARRRRSLRDPAPLMMLQTACTNKLSTSLDNSEALWKYVDPEQNNSGMEMGVTTEISTAPISSATSTAERPRDAIHLPEPPRKTFVGGTSIRSQGPLSPPAEYSNRHWERRALSSQRQQQTPSSASHADSPATPLNASHPELWVWSPKEPTSSVFSMRSRSTSGVSSTLVPKTRPRGKAIPLSPAFKMDDPSSPVHNRINSMDCDHPFTSQAPRSPSTSKSDPLFRRPPAQPPSPEPGSVPPVPLIPKPFDLHRNSNGSLRWPSSILSSRNPAPPSQTGTASSPQRRVGFREPIIVEQEPRWLFTQPMQSSAES